HEMSVECQECGIEIKPDMANCINCGADFTDDEQYMEDEYPAEESYEEPAAVEMPVQEVYEDELELSDEFDESLSEEEVADQVPGEEFPEPTIPTDSQEPEEPISMLPLEIGTELPTEHEEHKQCSGCGIFVDLKESICPVCDTEFDVVDPSVPDEEIEIQSEEDELSGFGVEVEPDSDVIESEETPDEITVPEEGTDHVECPSCGADVEAGTASCPVCEYPLDS
ncbi:MAG: hypothetical protein KAR56_03540, partial [Thermoplasmata archaeon]|nr:hypothetical protein [Thermoplasmata archaeon]